MIRYHWSAGKRPVKEPLCSTAVKREKFAGKTREILHRKGCHFYCHFYCPQKLDEKHVAPQSREILQTFVLEHKNGCKVSPRLCVPISSLVSGQHIPRKWQMYLFLWCSAFWQCGWIQDSGQSF